MDNSQLTTAGLTATFTALVGIAYKIYMVVNHKRIRSNCCGKKLEASIDIDNTSPPDVVLNIPAQNFINNPIVNQNGQSLCAEPKT
jgi:hypothetical protein